MTTITTKLRRRRTKGSALVELALFFPLFAILLIGIVDFAQFLFLQQAIVERARYAARWGAAANPSNTVAIANVVLYFQTTAPQAGQQASFGLTPAMVQVAERAAGTDDYCLVVTISGYTIRLFSPLIAGKYQGRPIIVTVPLGPYA
jgi:Flp pilus assembly protein TadG